MENFKNFFQNKLNSNNLNKIVGGQDRVETCYLDWPDHYEDENGNELVDCGETIVMD